MKTLLSNLTVFGDPIQVNALEQIKVCLKHPDAVKGALMADHHKGYSMPIGGVIAYEDAVSPSGVGFDIACGNKCVKTNVILDDLAPGYMVNKAASINAVMREIQRNIEFGVGRNNADPIEHPVFERDIWQEINKNFGPGQALYQKARAQLGTVGSGNHYVDLLVDDEGFIWVANHFGSRGLGHTIASGFFAKHAGLDFTDRVKESEVVFSTKTDLGQFYIEAMKLAGEYAYAGRDYVIEQVLNILGAEATFSVHNHHNFAWLEDGLWIVRKGATPLTLEPAFIGGSMGDDSVIVRGTPDVGSEDRHTYGVEDLNNLGSAPHGAGRVMSRNEAAGKVRKMWYCNNRNCEFAPERSTGDNTEYERNCCPHCGLPLRRGKMRDTTDAQIDWDAVRADLKERGIVVLGAGADEAPGVYKSLTDVIGAHPNIEILHTLHPIGVVMAGPDERDPYAD